MAITSKGIRILKTVNIYISFLCMGICFSVLPPSLIDLMELVNTDIKHITLIFTALSAGWLFSSLAGGIYFDRTNKKQSILAALCFITSISMFGIPWSKNITTLLAWATLLGVTFGTIHVGGNSGVIDLWGQASKTFLQALHLSLSIGSLIGPLLAAPFFASYSSNNTELELNHTSEIQHTALNITTTVAKHGVTYIFMTVASFFIIITIFFIIMTIVSPTDENNQKGILSESNDISLKLKYVVVVLGCVLLSTIYSFDCTFVQMLTIHATKGTLRLSTSTASYMASVFYGTGTISRLAAIFFTIKFSILSLIIIELLITGVGIVILVFLAEYHEWALWMSISFLGTGITCLFPASISLIENHIVITNTIMAIFEVGSAACGILIPYIMGHFIEGNPSIFKYANLLCFTVIISVTFILYFILRKMPGKYTKKEKKDTDCSSYITDSYI